MGIFWLGSLLLLKQNGLALPGGAHGGSDAGPGPRSYLLATIPPPSFAVPRATGAAPPPKSA